MNRILYLLVLQTLLITSAKAQVSSRSEPIEKNDDVLISIASPLSFWAGSTLSYSFENEGSDNFIGGGLVQLETFKRFQNNKKFKLLIVGNIAKITSSLSEEDVSDDISEIVLSDQGLSIGFAPIYQLWNKDVKGEKGDYIRLYGNVGYKVNGFQDAGPDNETINLDQFRASIGIEYEGLEVSSGAPTNLSSELVYSFYDGSKYESIFGDFQSNFIAIESQLIIPIGNKLGFLLKHTWSTRTNGVFQLGLVLSSSHKEMSSS